jgi:hypothetical protein
MYCTECGAKGTGKFCAACGTRLTPPDTDLAGGDAARALADLMGDWSHIVDYQTLLRHADVRERIAQAAAESTSTLTGEEFLQWCEKALKPITQVPIPLAAIARISQPLNTSLGMKTGKQRAEFVAQPPGRVLVGVLCSMARQGHKLKHARQIENGCVLEAELVSDMFALAGRLSVTVRRHDQGALLEAATQIPGQLFDWGKSSRCLDQILTAARSAA